MCRKNVFVVILITLLSNGRVFAEEAKAPATEQHFEEFILLGIDKKSMTANLRTLSTEESHQSLELNRFRIAIGKELGDKDRIGDNKTPEGVYFTLKHVEKENLLTSKYGEAAIPLDFPNPYDRFERKTGYGIWLHGAGNDERIAVANTTEGCVAFYNADILKLRTWIKPNQSVVVIAQDINEINKRVDLTDVRKATLEWAEAWRSRNIDSYMQAYDVDFNFDGKKWAEYKAYKKLVFASYKQMTVEMEQMRVVTHPKYAVTFMNQDFKGDQRFKSKGRKVLFWQKIAGTWKIIREHYNSGFFKPLTFSTADTLALQSDSKKATQAL